MDHPFRPAEEKDSLSSLRGKEGKRGRARERAERMRGGERECKRERER
jgi:hypothetical protein